MKSFLFNFLNDLSMEDRTLLIVVLIASLTVIYAIALAQHIDSIIFGLYSSIITLLVGYVIGYQAAKRKS